MTGATHPALGSRKQRLSLVAALYSTQNLSLGFFTYAFLTIAQARGVPLALIGAAAGLAAILTLKFLWAPVVDKFGSARLGHYRGWLIATQSGLGIGAASLALFDPAEDFAVLLVLFAVLFLLAATQDIAADAAATRLLPPEERGLGNGFQSAGASVAQVVGGGVVLVVYQFAGWQIAALTLACFSLVALPFIMVWKEAPSTADQPSPRVTLKSIWAFFKVAETKLWCLVLIPAYSLGFTVAYNLVRPILVDAGWGEARIGLYVVIAGSGLGILGGICGGAFISTIGRRPALIWLGVLQIAATAGTLPLALGYTQEWLVLCVVALSNAAFSAAFAVIFTISMDLTRPESAGTDFTLFTTATALMMVIAGAGGISAAAAFGFGPVILGAVFLAALGLGLVVRLMHRIPSLQVSQRATVPA